MRYKYWRKLNMKKKIVLALVILIVGYVIFSWHSSIKLRNLPGEFIYSNGQGIHVFHFQQNTDSILLDNIIGEDLGFNTSSENILVYDSNTYSIKEVDYKTKDVKNLLWGMFSDVQYVPNKHAISFVQNEMLYYYDLNANNKYELIPNKWGYSWNNSGESFIYEKEGVIYSYEVSTPKSVPILKGRYPQYSSQNHYIVYRKDIGLIAVRDSRDQREWVLKSDGVRYKFSPDERFVAILRPSTKGISKDMEIVVWDFQKGKTKVILDPVPSYSGFEWR